jgi:hypothetical protein
MKNSLFFVFLAEGGWQFEYHSYYSKSSLSTPLCFVKREKEEKQQPQQ